MGSDSDLPVMRETFAKLEAFGIPFEAKITSAHRTPDATHHYVTDADKRGCGVFIAAAGMAAHLAGVVASLTVKPVIGVPMASGSLAGVDALLSTVQMPAGIPVPTVAIGKAGARNAAFVAAQILAIGDAELAQKLRDERSRNAAEIADKDAALNQEIKSG
ncbi:MAG: 5-(carboxyamino)imidazole ribonucleotide mutase [Pseudomonadota bacterium]